MLISLLVSQDLGLGFGGKMGKRNRKEIRRLVGATEIDRNLFWSSLRVTTCSVGQVSLYPRVSKVYDMNLFCHQLPGDS